MTVKGKFNKKAIKEKIKKLEEKLKKVENSNQVVWEAYGSELACGGMIEEERKIAREINILKNKLAPNEVYNELLARTFEHRNELVFNCGPELVILLEGIEDDGEDYYWRMFSLQRGYHLSSCVGRIDPIKGKVDDEVYNFLFGIFKLNYKRVLTMQDDNLVAYSEKTFNKIVNEIDGVLK